MKTYVLTVTDLSPNGLTRLFYTQANSLNAAMIKFTPRLPTKGNATLSVVLVDQVQNLDIPA